MKNANISKYGLILSILISVSAHAQNSITKEESMQWKQYICEGKYTQSMDNNTVLQKDITAQAGFAYHRSNDKITVQFPGGAGNRWNASSAENRPNFSSSSTSKDAKYVIGMYSQQSNGGMRFNTEFDIKNSSLKLIWSVGGLDYIYTGKCHVGDFL